MIVPVPARPAHYPRIHITHIWKNGKTPARVARPARKIFHKQPLDLWSLARARTDLTDCCMKYCFSNQNALKQIIPACGIILNQWFRIVNQWFSVVNRWFILLNHGLASFFKNDNLDNKDRSTSGRLQGKNFLPTTATAVYGIQPLYLETDATKGCKTYSCFCCFCCRFNNQATKGRVVVK